MTAFSQTFATFRRFCQQHNLNPDGVKINIVFPTMQEREQAVMALRLEAEMLTLDESFRGSNPSTCYGIKFELKSAEKVFGE